MCNITATFTEVNSGQTLSNGYVTRVQWRNFLREGEQGPDAGWRSAHNGDVLREGDVVRVSTAATAILRLEKTCGCKTKKATVTLNSGATFAIPSEVPDKDVVKTGPSGRADFKIDKVGLTNDFKVVTRSTTLAVRG